NIFRKRTILSLLLFLIRNAGKGFSQEEIYKEIWGWEYDEITGGTEVRKNISRLRDLLEPDKDNLKYILLREAFLGEKGKYYFNSDTEFCFIDEVVSRES
ncbi:MAG: helix-turn-helix domain-containing protein, partial [Candidatus Eremiobacterota bacterium]